MEIKLLIGKKNEYENPNIEKEEEILKEFKVKFDYEFSIIHNSADYSTLRYKDFDILRLKYGTKSKWIKVYIFPKNKSKYENNPLFDKQKNKNEFLWKSIIETPDDLDQYIEIIKEQIEYLK